MLIRKSSDWLCARAGDELMMMNGAQGCYIGLDVIGARIWDLLDRVQTVDGLCAQLLTEFDVEDAQCRTEVEAFLTELEHHNAITRESAGAS